LQVLCKLDELDVCDAGFTGSEQVWSRVEYLAIHEEMWKDFSRRALYLCKSLEEIAIIDFDVLERKPICYKNWSWEPRNVERVVELVEPKSDIELLYSAIFMEGATRDLRGNQKKSP
jgi:hypothetical protein